MWWPLLVLIKTTLDVIAGPEAAAQPGGWEVVAFCTREATGRMYPHCHLVLQFIPGGILISFENEKGG